MLITPGLLSSSGLSPAVIPPEIAPVALIMLVPFLSALVISRVPPGWEQGHGTAVTSLKRLCFPCAGIKLMAQQSPGTLGSLSCPCQTQTLGTKRARCGKPEPWTCRNVHEQSQIVPAREEGREGEGEKGKSRAGRGGRAGGERKNPSAHGGVSLQRILPPMLACKGMDCAVSLDVITYTVAVKLRLLKCRRESHCTRYQGAVLSTEVNRNQWDV